MNIKWTRFMDMHSGGGCKLDPYETIYIEAPEAEARVIFYNRFGRDPDCVTCTCCGADYSVSEGESLLQETGYDRGCHLENGGYVDKPSERHSYLASRYCTLDEYRKRPDVLIIEDVDIKPEERVGEVVRQGYIWAGGER